MVGSRVFTRCWEIGKDPFVLIQGCTCVADIVVVFCDYLEKSQCFLFLPVKWNNSKVGSTELNVLTS